MIRKEAKMIILYKIHIITCLTFLLLTHVRIKSDSKKSRLAFLDRTIPSVVHQLKSVLFEFGVKKLEKKTGT